MRKKLCNTVILIPVLCLILLNILTTKRIVTHGFSTLQRKFSFIGRDFPEIPTLLNNKKVVIVVEESVHYSIDGLEANEEWAVMKVAGNGFVTLGPQERGFALPMFHELHCLRLMRWALAGHYDSRSAGHMDHCLNYLRQEILCAADSTLEPADVLERDFNISRTGATFVCLDWRELYQVVEENVPRVFKANH